MTADQSILSRAGFSATWSGPVVSGRDRDRVLAELGRLRSGQVWADAASSERVRFLDLAYPDRDLQPQALLDEIDAWGRSLRDRGDVQTLLYIGFGGSALGPRLLSEVFAEEDGRERIRVEVLDSIDPGTVSGLLQRLDLSTTHILVCSKSSVTYEAVALYRMSRWFWDSCRWN